MRGSVGRGSEADTVEQTAALEADAFNAVAQKAIRAPLDGVTGVEEAAS